MESAQRIASAVLVVFAMFFVVMNWAWFVANLRSKWRGDDKHISTVPVLSLVLVILCDQIKPDGWSNSFWIIPCVDIGNLMLLTLPFRKF